MRSTDIDPKAARTTRVLRLLTAAVFIFQQPMSTAVIVVDGSCSLADAITAANSDAVSGGCSAGSGMDEIQLTGNVTLTSELPQVIAPVVFEGNSFSVSRYAGATDFRIFNMPGPGTVTLRNITVSNGHADMGGGVYNDTPLTILNSTISGNVADTRGGGVYSGWDGPVDLIDSTLADNVAGTDGGGMYTSFGSSTEITGSTISGNSATSDGGGFYNSAYNYMTVTNSTISGNSAGGDGGGIYNAFYAGDIDLINTTVVGNSASEGGGFYAYPAFLSPTETPQGHYTEIFLTNSLIAYNTGGNCAGDGQHDLGGNFDDDGSCEGAAPIIADVDFDTTLADNGGPTATHALLAGSLAIDAGGACALSEDQRGFARDPLCDSGAYEFGAGPPPFGGGVTGLRARFVVCRNFDNGSSVQIDVMGGNSWDCDAAGFVDGSGDAIGQVLNGIKSPGSTQGVLTGIDATQVTCQNRTTGTEVIAPLNVSLEWNCDTAGLIASNGDRLRIVVQGVAP